MILTKAVMSHKCRGFGRSRELGPEDQQIEARYIGGAGEPQAAFQAPPGRTRIITSTRLISVPAGGMGRLVTVSSSPGMSCSLPVTSQKKWWWSEVLVSKYDRPGSTTTSCKSPESVNW